MFLKHQKGKSRALGLNTTAAWEFSKEMFFHEKTPAGRKRNVLWKRISFKVGGAQTFEMQSREHEVLGFCLVPCALHRSQGFLSVCSALSCFRFSKNTARGQPGAGGFLQPQEEQGVTGSQDV